MSAAELILYLLGGFLAGIINTLAGNGSAITLSLLIFSGMPAPVANATNRVGALAQTLTAVLSLRRSKRTFHLMRQSTYFLLPALLGSLVGAWLVVDIPELLLKRIIGVVMLFLLGTLLLQPKRWARPTQPGHRHRTVLNQFLVFLIGLYGGFIQMGIGIMLLSLLVLWMRYSLRDGNIIKLLLAITFVLPAFLFFSLSGQIDWGPGLILAAGQMLGAFLAARYMLFWPGANKLLRYLLIVILSISAVGLLGLGDPVIQWLKPYFST